MRDRENEIQGEIIKEARDVSQWGGENVDRKDEDVLIY